MVSFNNVTCIGLPVKDYVSFFCKRLNENLHKLRMLLTSPSPQNSIVHELTLCVCEVLKVAIILKRESQVQPRTCLLNRGFGTNASINLDEKS